MKQTTLIFALLLSGLLNAQIIIKSTDKVLNCTSIESRNSYIICGVDSVLLKTVFAVESTTQFEYSTVIYSNNGSTIPCKYIGKDEQRIYYLKSGSTAMQNITYADFNSFKFNANYTDDFGLIADAGKKLKAGAGFMMLGIILSGTGAILTTTTGVGVGIAVAAAGLVCQIIGIASLSSAGDNLEQASKVHVRPKSN